MKLWSSLVAILLLSCSGWPLVSCRHAAPQTIVARVTPSPTPSPTPLSTQFEPTGMIDMFMEDYVRPSDGAVVRFHCSDRASAAKALSLVTVKSTARLIEHTDVVDSAGATIGERVVRLSQEEAEITWNEGARFFDIIAESLSKVRTFEKAKTWRRECVDARSWP